MNDELTDDQVRAAFVARSAGSPSPDLADRIRAAAADTKQERPAMHLVGLAPLTRTRFLAVAAVVGASVAVLAGSLFLGGGSTKTDRPAIVPTGAPPTAAPSGRSSTLQPTAVPSIRRPTLGPSSAPSLVQGVPLTSGTVATVSSADPLELYSTLKIIDGPRLPGSDKIAEVETGTSLYVASSVLANLEGGYWYLVKPFDQDTPERSFPLGWVRGDEGGTPTMESGTARCVVGDPTPAAVFDLTAVGALACFGGQDFVVTGRVACTTNASRPEAMQHRASGPVWLDDGRFCAFRADDGEPYFEIFEFSAAGLPGDWQAQDLVVTGHLADDLGWQSCFGREGPPYVTDAEAEFECRLGFHSTKVALAAGRR